MLLLSLLSLAVAQDQGISMPELDAQLYRAPIDAERTLWADDTSYKPDGYYGARLLINYMHDLSSTCWARKRSRSSQTRCSPT